MLLYLHLIKRSKQNHFDKSQERVEKSPLLGRNQIELKKKEFVNHQRGENKNMSNPLKDEKKKRR